MTDLFLQTIRKQKLFLKIVLIIICLTITAFYFYPAHNKNVQLIKDIFTIFSSLAAMIGASSAVRMYGLKNTHGKAFFLFFLGAAAVFFTDFTWIFYNQLEVVPTFPTWQSFFVILAYPLLFWAILKEVAVTNKKTLKRLRFYIIITTIIFILCVYFSKYFNNAVYSIDTIITMSYVFGSILLIIFGLEVVGVSYQYAGGKLFYPWLQISFGFILLFISNIVLAMNITSYQSGINYIYEIVNVLWYISFIVIAYGLFNIYFVIKEVQHEIYFKDKNRLSVKLCGTKVS